MLLKHPRIIAVSCTAHAIGNQMQWNRLRWFDHVCRMDNSRLSKCLLWAEHPNGWRCPPNASKKQWKDQVAADVSTHLTRRLYRDPLTTAADMMAEHGDWRGLWYDITGIKRRCDDSSERAHPDATTVDG